MGRSYNVKVEKSVEMFRLILMKRKNLPFHAMKPSIKSGAQFYCTFSMAVDQLYLIESIKLASQ